MNVYTGVGRAFPDVALPTLDGRAMRIADLRGSKLLIYMWGSWWRCREQLPGWQRFIASHRSSDWSFVSIAVEHADPEAARFFAKGCSFPTVVDSNGDLARQFGFKVVPNGVLVDEQGTVRWTKFGGFSVDDPGDIATVESFLAGQDPGPSPESGDAYTLGEVERDLVATTVRLGRVLLEYGRRDEAVAAWRDALRLDPGNFTIRKQIWSVEYPEKFYPAIDFGWQGVQLEAERAREIAEGDCGPDGCPIAHPETR